MGKNDLPKNVYRFSNGSEKFYYLVSIGKNGEVYKPVFDAKEEQSTLKDLLNTLNYRENANQQ